MLLISNCKIGAIPEKKTKQKNNYFTWWVGRKRATRSEKIKSRCAAFNILDSNVAGHLLRVEYKERALSHC